MSTDDSTQTERRDRTTITPFWELMNDQQKADWVARGRPATRKKSELKLYRTDAVLVRSYTPACAGTKSASANIGEKMSTRSTRNLIFILNNSDVPMRSMLTFTMTPEVNDAASVKQHRKIFKNALQHLRDKHCSQYVWVREFQENESLHWHIFAAFDCEPTSGDVDEHLTTHWSNWFCNQYQKLFPGLDYTYMRHGNGSDFFGCVRVEKLRSDAAGRYAGKEGGKRLQKSPPEKWKQGGGAWWRNSKGLTCSVLDRVIVDVAEIDCGKIVANGKVLEVPYRVQFNASKKFGSRKDDE